VRPDLPRLAPALRSWRHFLALRGTTTAGILSRPCVATPCLVPTWPLLAPRGPIYPAWIRTRTKGTKIPCATVTPPGTLPSFSSDNFDPICLWSASCLGDVGRLLPLVPPPDAFPGPLPTALLGNRNLAHPATRPTSRQGRPHSTGPPHRRQRLLGGVLSCTSAPASSPARSPPAGASAPATGGFAPGRRAPARRADGRAGDVPGQAAERGAELPHLVPQLVARWPQRLALGALPGRVLASRLFVGVADHGAGAWAG
jgi:hypothetical protein